MIGIVDYGAGNLQSVAHAFERLGVAHRACGTVSELAGVDGMVLPGVGHFGSAARQLERSGLADAILERSQSGMPLLGICLGLQLLLDASDEAPDANGLGMIPGRTVALEIRRVPHMGWNRVVSQRASPIFDGDDHFYFAHGFVAQLRDSADGYASSSVEDVPVPAIVGRRNVWGVQFHPEKSGEAGLALLERFSRC